MVNSTLVLGIGNEFRSDDGVGIYFARQIQALNITQVTVTESFGEGTELMEMWKAYKQLIICDAVCSGEEPGTLHILEPHKAKIPTQFFHYSTHAFSLAEAIEMSRMLGTLPAIVTIYGIEGESFSAGTTLTTKVAMALTKVIAKVTATITEQ